MRKERGIVFFMTLVLLGLVALICSALFMLMLRDTYTVKRIKYSKQAYSLAEAGVEEAIKELYNDFNYAGSGGAKGLGNGTYTVTMSNYPSDASRRLIISVGGVREVIKTIRAQVYYAGPLAFNYPALGGGKLSVAGGTVISNTGPVTVHSNSSGNGAVEVGSVWPWSWGRVVGRATAVGTVLKRPNGEITNGWSNNQPYIPLPPFDDNFFNYYKNLANADGKFFPSAGVMTFNSDPCAGTTNKVVYVEGQVRLNGTWEMTGCIVATGKIIINKWASGRITQHQWQNLPAFMSKGSDVEIWDPTDIEGMVYANGFIHIDSIFGSYGPTVVYGALYGKSWVNIKGATELHYRRPSPPGLPADTLAVNILSWTES